MKLYKFFMKKCAANSQPLSSTTPPQLLAALATMLLPQLDAPMTAPDQVMGKPDPAAAGLVLSIEASPSSPVLSVHQLSCSKVKEESPAIAILAAANFSGWFSGGGKEEKRERGWQRGLRVHCSCCPGAKWRMHPTCHYVCQY